MAAYPHVMQDQAILLLLLSDLDSVIELCQSEVMTFHTFKDYFIAMDLFCFCYLFGLVLAMVKGIAQLNILDSG